MSCPVLGMESRTAAEWFWKPSSPGKQLPTQSIVSCLKAQAPQCETGPVLQCSTRSPARLGMSFTRVSSPAQQDTTWRHAVNEPLPYSPEQDGSSGPGLLTSSGSAIQQVEAASKQVEPPLQSWLTACSDEAEESEGWESSSDDYGSPESSIASFDLDRALDQLEQEHEPGSLPYPPSSPVPSQDSSRFSTPLHSLCHSSAQHAEEVPSARAWCNHDQSSSPHEEHGEGLYLPGILLNLSLGLQVAASASKCNVGNYWQPRTVRAEVHLCRMQEHLTFSHALRPYKRMIYQMHMAIQTS
jgi:hypothetical protein